MSSRRCSTISPQRLTVVPGNHDAYVAAPFLETFAKWAPYLAADEGAFTGLYPNLRVRGPAALIGLSSARPSAPFMAVGSLGRAQLKRLEELLAQTGRRGLLRIVLLHHPPVAGSIIWRKRLTDADPLARVLARQGAGGFRFSALRRRRIPDRTGSGLPAIICTVSRERKANGRCG